MAALVPRTGEPDTAIEVTLPREVLHDVADQALEAVKAYVGDADWPSVARYSRALEQIATALGKDES